MKPLHDISGQVFGRLTALSYRGGGRWICSCGCGGFLVVRLDALTSGRTKSCGCARRERSRMLVSAMAPDLAGERFGSLVVTGRAEAEASGAHWSCVCDCGNSCVVRATALASGHTKSCGCARRRKKDGTPQDLSGRGFGQLTVLELAPVGGKQGRSWLCRCSCGNTTIARGKDLVSGNTKSCGCVKLLRSLENAQRTSKIHPGVRVFPA